MSPEPHPAELSAPPVPLLRKQLGRLGLRVIAGVTLAGLLVRLLTGDRWPVLATLFYATPLPLLVVGSAVSLIGNLARGQRAWSLVWCVLLLGTAGACWQRDFERQSPQELSGDEIRVMFWNAARQQDMTDAAAFINRVDADVVGLVEAGRAQPEHRRFWAEHCPEYDVSFLGGGLILLVKGTSGETVPGDLGYESFYRRIPVRVRDREFMCVVVDLKSDPLYPRGPVLGKLAADMSEFHEQPLVVMGDFNTPSDSIHYAALRESHREAFESAGHGYSPTWPYPWPVMTLDQMWLNGKVNVLQCERVAPVHSDHFAVLSWLQLL